MTIGWGMIGTGRVHKWVAPAIQKAKDTRLVAVLSRDKQRAAAFAREFGIERAYTSLDDLLRDPDINAVYVGSPNGLHASQTIQAASAGKHVLCEKPMAPTVAECRSMIDACRKHGVRLGLGLQYRQHPAHRKAREIVAAGELGRLEYANAQVEIPPLWTPGWYFEPGMAGGGAMYLVGVHRIDLLRFMLGREVVEVGAFIGEQPPERPFEDFVLGMLRFDDGAFGSMHFSLNIPHGANTLEMHGNKGSLYCIDTTSLWWGGSGGELLLKRDGGTIRYQFDKTDVYLDEIEDFNRSVLGTGEPLATGTDGLRAAEVSLALFEAGRKRGTVKVGE
ncbi:MAG: Gfo/Idh/MocA family oxidoreductase [Dehalococcoidia bacterium]|nr:Gfo/Idh/MocA family oxidoreductase [Dehalococcoidia bacterium]